MGAGHAALAARRPAARAQECALPPPFCTGLDIRPASEWPVASWIDFDTAGTDCLAMELAVVTFKRIIYDTIQIPKASLSDLIWMVYYSNCYDMRMSLES